MTATEIRRELLTQHANIRTLIAAIRRTADSATRGADVGEALREALERLDLVLREHNAREEALLGAIIPTVDAWGPARAEIMGEAHRREHQELVETLCGMPVTPIEFAGAGAQALFDRLLAHMESEEKVFLGDDVLKDDTVVVEIGG